MLIFCLSKLLSDYLHVNHSIAYNLIIISHTFEIHQTGSQQNSETEMEDQRSVSWT